MPPRNVTVLDDGDYWDILVGRRGAKWSKDTTADQAQKYWEMLYAAA